MWFYVEKFLCLYTLTVDSPAKAQSVAFSKNRPCPSSGKGGPYAQQDAQRDVEEESAVEALPEHRHSLMAEGGEGGESSAKPRGEQQAGIVREVETGRPSIKQADAEAAQDVDTERCPGEEERRDALVQGQLDAIAEKASDASSQKNHAQCLSHVVVIKSQSVQR